MSSTDKALEDLVSVHYLSAPQQHALAAKVSAMAELLVEKGLITREEYEERYAAKKRIVQKKIRENIQNKKKRITPR